MYFCRCTVVFLRSFISALFLYFFQLHPYLKSSFTETFFPSTNNIFTYFCFGPVLLSCLVRFTFVFLPFSVILIMITNLSSHFLSCVVFCSSVSCFVLLYLVLFLFGFIFSCPVFAYFVFVVSFVYNNNKAGIPSVLPPPVSSLR